MKLYRVTNGWFGNGEVYVLVVADSEQAAHQLAEEKFKSEQTGLAKQAQAKFWDKLEVTLVNNDLDRQWVSKVED